MTINSLTDPKDHRQWNEVMARRHDPDTFITKSGFFIRKMEFLRIKKTIELLNAGPSDLVLDVGCGAGNLLGLLNRGQAVGVEPSQYLLDQARARLAKGFRAGVSPLNPVVERGPASTRGEPSGLVLGSGGKGDSPALNPYTSRVNLIKGEGEKLPFPNETFDRVVCSEVLEHARFPDIILQEISRVAKSGALIVVTWPNEIFIQWTKRLVIALGIKKLIAGRYNMSDNMLDDWHVREIDQRWIADQAQNGLVLRNVGAIPCGLTPYHYVACLQKRWAASLAK
ncbi:MAG: methyltransferase domain-containing protein [Elusimicrobia bacterium]|nr:methyltransferase domain-containing protein [Elusimicrobiota bacterium]